MENLTILNCYEIVDEAKGRGVQTKGMLALARELERQDDLIDRIESDGLDVMDSRNYRDSVERCDGLAWEAAKELEN